MGTVRTDGRVEVDGVELVWQDHRPADGELDPGVRPLVIVHGYTGSHRDFDEVIDALADGRRVITYDHRGHGASANTGDAGTYTLDQLAADLAVLVDALGLGRFDLLGHSMGGIVALRYLFGVPHAPERVASLILVDSAAAPDVEQTGGRDLMRAGFQLAREGGMEPVINIVGMFLGAGPGGEDARRRMEVSFRQLDPVAFEALGEAVIDYPSMLDQLPALALPTTVIVGADDVALRGSAEDLAAGIPGAELVVIDGAGHLPQQDQPEAWLAAVHQHLVATTATAGGG